MTKTKQLEKIVIKALKELKAIDIVTIDVKHVTSITDAMIICTGTSSRHVKSIADKVLQNLSIEKIKPLSVEGENEGEWVLIDIVDIMVHIMQQRTRDFYQLETLWHIPKLKKKPTSKKGTVK